MLKQKGMNVFIRINHVQGAQKVGKKLIIDKIQNTRMKRGMREGI